MVLVSLLLALLLLALTGMGAHRHRQVVAWERELDLAFRLGMSWDRPRHRSVAPYHLVTAGAPRHRR